MTQGIYSTLCGVIAEQLAASVPTQPQLDPELAHLRRALSAAVSRPSYRHARTDRYRPLLDRALDGGHRDGIRPVAAALQALPAELPWDYHYPPHGASADLAAKIGFAELIGPDGPLMGRECRAGFTLIDADTYYPLHAHPAIEMYWVIAGTALWTAAGASQVVPPGGYVLHGTNQPHAMQTTHEPLLALYSWRGDLETAAYYL